MKAGVQKALIGAIGAIAATMVAVPATMKLSNNNNSKNSNTMIISVDGEKTVVTSEKYEEIVRENENLKSENKKLSKEIALKSETKAEEDKTDKSNETKQGMKGLKVVNSMRFEELKPYTDSYGEIYDIAHHISGNFNGGFVTYGLQGKYKSFTATIVAFTENAPDAYAKVNVYKNDDELIDSITGINKSDEARQLGPYDVSGASNIKFEVDIDSYSSGKVDCCLVNVVAE